MKIENKVYKLTAKKSGSWLETVSASFAAKLERNTYPLRFSIVNISRGEITVEATTIGERH